MGHTVIKCPKCGDFIMEGHNDWECDCGWNSEDTYVETLKPKPIPTQPKPTKPH